MTKKKNIYPFAQNDHVKEVKHVKQVKISLKK